MTSIDSGGIANANVLREQFEGRGLNADVSAETADIVIVGAGAFGSSLALELVTHHRDKYRAMNAADVDMSPFMCLINGRFPRAMQHPRIPTK